MPLFVPTLNKQFDQEWDRFLQQKIPGIALPEIRHAGELGAKAEQLDAALRKQALREPPIVIPMHPPSPIGTLLLDDSEAANAGLTCFVGIGMLKSLDRFFALHQTGVTEVYASFAAGSNSSEIAISCWVHFGEHVRMMISPRINRVGGTISISFGHVILWRPPWMNQHPDTHSWWIDLASNYREHFQGDYGLYASAFQQINQNRRFFHVPKWRRPEFFERGPLENYVHISESHKSLYYFAVGDIAFPHASRQGAVHEQMIVALRRMYSKLLKMHEGGSGEATSDFLEFA